MIPQKPSPNDTHAPTRLRARRRKWALFTLIIDLTLVNVGFVLAFVARFGGIPPALNFQAYTQTALFITVLMGLSFYAFDLYGMERGREPVDTIVGVAQGATLGMLLVLALSFLLRAFPFPRTVFVIAWAFIIVLTSVVRISSTRLFPFEFPVQRIVIVGSGPVANALAREVERHASYGYRLIGLVADDGGEQNEYPVIGTPENLTAVLETHAADRVIVATPREHRELVEQVWESTLADIHVEVVPDLYEIFVGRVSPSTIADIPLVELSRHPADPVVRLTKRVVDIVFSVMLILLTFPVTLLAAIMVILASRGPLFYVQERVGLFEHRFVIFKFRTMVQEAERETGPVLASADDERVTWIGRILRRYRIDELPQLINILRGDMSLVGPRAERPVFVDRFKEEIPGYAQRFRAKPGATGLAQILGRYDTSAMNKLKYDLIYVYNQTLALDLWILLQTVRVVLTGKGAQ